MARVNRLVLAFLLLLATAAHAVPSYSIISATAFVSSIPVGTFTTAAGAANQYVTNANSAIVNQGGCTGSKSVSLTSAPTPAASSNATGGISFSWMGRQWGGPSDPCVSFGATGTFVIHAGADTGSDWCASKTGQAYGPTVFAVSDVSGNVGNAITSCFGPLGPMADGSTVYCSVAGRVDMCGGTGSGTAGNCWTTGNVGTGASCSPTGATAAPTSVTNAPTGGSAVPPPGYCPGTVNGVTVWVPCTTTVESTPKSTTETVTTSSGTSTVAVTENNVTTCSGAGSCTTVTTVTTSTTTGTGTSSVTTSTQKLEDKATYCAANPKATTCGGTGEGGEGKGSFGGSCGSGGSAPAFTCSDDTDAISCAIAKATNELKCGMLERTSNESTLYDSTVAAGTSTTGLSSTTTAISNASFDQTSQIGAASCIADKSITIDVAGSSKTLSLPFSMVCSWLEVLGSILMSISFLLAMRIVFKG